MNGWKLCIRYKKHLPAPARGRRSDAAVIRRSVEQILTSIWAADDWDPAIRDPELVASEPLDASQRADWQRRLTTT